MKRIVLLGFILVVSLVPCLRSDGGDGPEGTFTIDFNRNYDIAYSFGESGMQVLKNCKILGFTGRDQKNADPRIQSLNDKFSGYLVVQLPDKRIAYIKEYQLVSIEQPKNQ
jgi:hypothetical protein